MAQEKQTPLMLRKNPYAEQNNGYLVYADGDCVGRIFFAGAFKAAPEDRPWFWGLDFHSWQGCTKAQYGHAETKEAAMAAFRVTWDSKSNRA